MEQIHEDDVFVTSCEINHDVLFNQSLDFESIEGNECLNCLNCGYPLCSEGLFFGNEKLVDFLKKNKMLKSYIQNFQFPKNIVYIPLDMKRTQGRACCEGCALRIIEKERRGTDAELKLKMSIHNKYTISAYFNKKLLKMYGGPKNNFLQEQNDELSDTIIASKTFFKQSHVNQRYSIIKERINLPNFDINNNYIWNRENHNNKQKTTSASLLKQTNEAQGDVVKPPKKKNKKSTGNCSSWTF